MMHDMTVTLHTNDLPSNISFGPFVAVDAEMMGLNPQRDRLCLIQLSSGDGTVHLVKFDGKDWSAPNLRKLLEDKNVTKIFHYARLDLVVIKTWLDALTAPVYCTKIASRLARTFTDHHSLKTVCKDLLGIEMDKHQQTTDWGAETLTQEQIVYAASDVLHLHKVREKLEEILKREKRTHLAQACFDFLPQRALLDVSGFAEGDIFAH